MQLADSVLILLSLLIVYLMAHSLIAAYFRRKEEFVDRLQAKANGEFYGTKH